MTGCERKQDRFATFFQVLQVATALSLPILGFGVSEIIAIRERLTKLESHAMPEREVRLIVSEVFDRHDEETLRRFSEMEKSLEKLSDRVDKIK